MSSSKRSRNRTIKDGFFPSGLNAGAIQDIKLQVLSKIIGYNTILKHDDVDEYKRIFKEYYNFKDDMTDFLWEAFELNYFSTPRGTRGWKRDQLHIKPFNPIIIRTVSPQAGHRYYPFYCLLMNNRDGPNIELHNKVMQAISGIEASNIFERMFSNVLNSPAVDELNYGDLPPIRPYLQECAINFQKDVESWLANEEVPSETKLEDFSNILLFHIFMYYLQLALNLRLEIEDICNFRPSIRPIYFGGWDEVAKNSRRFTTSWRGKGVESLERDIYDSWWRLVLLSICNDVLRNNSDYKGPKTFSEIYHDEGLAEMVRLNIIQNHEEEYDFPEYIDFKTLVEEAPNVIMDVEMKEYDTGGHSAISMGVKVIEQLGEKGNARFMRTQRKIGKTLRLDDNALLMFVKLFIFNTESEPVPRTMDNFFAFLSKRGIYFDNETECQIIDQFDTMGIIERYSDSGEALYVRNVF